MSTMLSLQAALRVPVAGMLARRIGEFCLTATRIAFSQFHAMMERSRQRNALARLDDRQLHDLGIPRTLVTRELGKWFWQS